MRQVGLGVILREQSFYHVTNVIIKNDAIVSKKRTITFPPLNPFQPVPWNHSCSCEFKGHQSHSRTKNKRFKKNQPSPSAKRGK